MHKRDTNRASDVARLFLVLYMRRGTNISFKRTKTSRTLTLKHGPRAAPRGAASTIMSLKTMQTTCLVLSERSEKRSIGRKAKVMPHSSPAYGI